MKAIIDFLKGKKTYIGAAIVGIIGALLWLGIIDQKTAEVILSFGGAILGIGLRQAIADTKSPN